MKIASIDLNEPRIHAISTKDGKANWNITKPTPETTTEKESKPFKLNLKHYGIHNGYINYQDAASNMSMVIVNLEHNGNGDFTSDLLTLATKTSADTITFKQGKG